MAVPTVRSVGAESNGTTGAVTVAAPASIATNDLELLFASTIAGATISITNNGGGSWTALGNQDVGSGERLYAWYRVRAPGDGNPQVTPSADHLESCRLAITADTFSPSNPIEIWHTSSEATSDTSFSYAPGTSTAGPNRLCVVAYAGGYDAAAAQGGTAANASLTSVSERFDMNTSQGGGGGFTIATGSRAAAGSVGTWSATMANATPKSYVSFAVRPALVGLIGAKQAPFALGIGNALGWGATPASTIRERGVRWDRVDLVNPFGLTVAGSRAAGFDVEAVLANSDNNIPLTSLDGPTIAAWAVSQAQSDPGAKVYEFINEPYLKANETHPVKYARLYMEALAALRAAGIREPLLYNGTGSVYIESVALMPCTFITGQAQVTCASTDELVAGMTLMGDNISDNPELSPNVDFESNITGWSQSGGATAAQSAAWAFSGAYSCRCTYTAPDGTARYPGVQTGQVACNSSRTHFMALRLKVARNDSGQPIKGQFAWYDAGHALIGYDPFDVGASAGEGTLSDYKDSPANAAYVILQIFGVTNGAGQQIDFSIDHVTCKQPWEHIASIDDTTHFTMGTSAEASGTGYLSFIGRWHAPDVSDTATSAGGWIGRALMTVPGLKEAISENGVNFHPYGMPTENTTGNSSGIAILAWHKAWFETLWGYCPPFAVSEFGYFIDGSTSGATTGTNVLDEAEQALRMDQALAAMASVSSVRLVIQYQSFDTGWGCFDSGTQNPRQSLQVIADYSPLEIDWAYPIAAEKVTRPDVRVLREYPPLDLSVLTTSSTGITRWAQDEPRPENVPTNIEFSSAAIGGFESASMSLARRPDIDYADLEEFSDVTIRDAGHDIVWQGRLESTPRTSGSQMAISPAAVGYQNHLDDNQSVKEVYVDIDMSRWQAISAQRRINLETANYGFEAHSVTADEWTGVPILATQMTGPWAGGHVCEANYHGNGVALGAIYYAWKRGKLDNADTNWSWKVLVGPDDAYSSWSATSELRAAGPGAGTLGGGATYKWAMVELVYSTGVSGAGWDGVTPSIMWTCLAAYGNHGLTLRGLADATHAQGLYPSDIVAHAVRTWAPKIAVSRAGESTITTAPLFIPQAAYLEPTTVSQIVKDVNRGVNYDWAVWAGPTFWYYPRNGKGRTWRARVGPSGLQETGPQVENIYNGVVVPFTDVSGVAMSVGPVAANPTYGDDSLLDTNPANPANAENLRRWKVLSPIGTSTQARATDIGRGWLSDQAALNTAGQAQLVAYVEDDHGVIRPASSVQGGDQIVFIDAHDPVPRRIVKASYSDSSKTCQIDLDSPPQGLDAALARISLAIAPYGLS